MSLNFRRFDNIVDTTDSVVAENQITYCVTCSFLHVLRDQLHHVAKKYLFMRIHVASNQSIQIEL